MYIGLLSFSTRPNPAEIEKKITAKTIGIIPVHTFCQPCDMDPIMEVAEKHHLWVMEDCAEAHFATYKGKKSAVSVRLRHSAPM